MKFKSLRWGYSGGGFACGPVPGDILVELMVADEGQSRFIFIASCMEGIEIKAGPMPFFDIFRFAVDDDFDVEGEIGKIDSYTEEHYGVLWGDELPDELTMSRYINAFRFAFMALNEFSNNEPPDLDEFLTNYEDVDIDDLNLPEINLEENDEYDEDA